MFHGHKVLLKVLSIVFSPRANTEVALRWQADTTAFNQGDFIHFFLNQVSTEVGQRKQQQEGKEKV